MLTRIRLQLLAEGSEYIDFDYGLDPLQGGYDILEVQGLGPPPASVSYDQYAMVPGGRYQSTRVEARNIVLTAALRPPPGKTVLDMRRDLYHALPARETLVARLWRDGEYELRVNGYVETIEPAMFSKDPTIKISIVCPEPYFRAPTTKTLERLSPGSVTIDNNGDIPAGLDVTFRIHSAHSNSLRLNNDTTGDTVRVLDDWAIDDRIRVNTTEGLREVTMRSLEGRLRGHLLGVTSIEGGWPMLHRGTNVISARSVAEDWTWDLSYVELYGGF